MFGEGLPVERLRQYLRELSPEAQALLVGELERGLLHAEEVPGTDLVLRELRRTMRDRGRAVVHLGNAARLFFQPLDPFLVEDGPDHRHRCRLARMSLEPFWSWISTDVMPQEAAAYIADMNKALHEGDVDEANGLIHKFQDRAVLRLAEALKSVRHDDKALNRLSVRLASKRAEADVETLMMIMRHRETFAEMAVQMGAQIKALADPHLGRIKQILDAPHAQDLLPYALVLVMYRLVAPWQLIRLAVQEAQSDIALRVAATRYGVAVDIVLDEIERMVRELRTELTSGQGIAVIALLKNIHDAARGLRTEIDLSADSPWSRKLAGIRAEISHLVKSEVESMPGRVRRLLRLRPANEIAPGQTLDLEDVTEVETLIGFVDACRHFASELAINEMTMRAVTELQQYLDSGRNAMLDGLRNASDRDRAYRQSQLEAAVRFCARIFGRDYAAVLSRAAEVAAGGDRKARA